MKLDLSIDFDKKKFSAYCEKLITSGAKCELKVLRAKRSISQNSYFHVVVSFFANETGYTISESKTLLKREFGSFMVYEKDGKRFLLSTTELDSLQMAEFIQWIRQVACYENLGIYCPSSEEYIANQFEIDKELNNVK
jgi:hypothetical protein